MRNRKQIFEIFTIFGWKRVKREVYWDFDGRKRWYWEDERPEDYS